MFSATDIFTAASHGKTRRRSQLYYENIVKCLSLNPLTPGHADRLGSKFKSICFKLILQIDIVGLPVKLVWGECHRANIVSGNGLVPSGNKPLTEPMLQAITRGNVDSYGITRTQWVMYFNCLLLSECIIMFTIIYLNIPQTILFCCIDFNNIKFRLIIQSESMYPLLGISNFWLCFVVWLIFQHGQHHCCQVISMQNTDSMPVEQYRFYKSGYF